MEILIVIIAILFGSVFIIKPVLNLWIVLIFSLFISGFVMYFIPSLGRLAWVAPILSVFLFLRIIVEALKSKKDTDNQLHPILMVMILFGFTAILSLTQNIKYPGEMISASKNIFAYWSIPFALYYINVEKKTIISIVIMVLIISLLQTPISIVQYKYFIAKSVLVVGDSITGSFGGIPGEGGNSGAQTTFLVCIIMILISYWIERQISFFKVFLLTSIMLIPILLNETKVFLLYMVVAVIMLVKFFLIKRPALSIVAIIFSTILFLSVIVYYIENSQYVTREYEREKTITGYIQKTLKMNATTKNLRYGRSKSLTRLSAPLFFFSEHFRNNDYLHMFIGHGLGAAKLSGIFTGHLYDTHKYKNKNIGLTGLSRLLWDLGIFGTTLYLLILIIAYICAGKIRKNHLYNVKSRALMVGLQISCVIFLLCTIYDVYLLRTPALNSFYMLILGLIVYFKKNKHMFIITNSEIEDKKIFKIGDSAF